MNDAIHFGPSDQVGGSAAQGGLYTFFVWIKQKLANLFLFLFSTCPCPGSEITP